MTDNKLLFPDESFAIRKVVFDVNREMGSGFVEAVYQECMERELTEKRIPFRSQVELKLQYKGEPLTQTYKPDIVCYEKIIIELKAVSKINAEHKAQLLNYLKATDLKLGLLVNFGSHPQAQIVRIVNTASPRV